METVLIIPKHVDIVIIPFRCAHGLQSGSKNPSKPTIAPSSQSQTLPSKPRHSHILNTDILLGADDLDFSRDKETEGTVRPGNSGEEVGVFSLRAVEEFTGGEDDVVCGAAVLEETVFVGRSLDERRIKFSQMSTVDPE